MGSAFGDQSQQDISKGENHYRWKKLKELSKHHIHQVVDDQMAQGNIDADKWGSFLHKFVIQAVDSVKPSSRYLKDSMDFNKYVDIRLVDNKDQSKCQLINGCVFMKNLSDKRMPHQFKNPKILLLKGSLGFMRENDDESQTMQPKQEIYMDI